MIHVPTLTDDNLFDLLSQINSSEEPRYVTCKPQRGAPINECFPLVDEKVITEGGKRVLGWQIWKGKLLIEAEFHAVWESQNGEWIDITPQHLRGPLKGSEPFYRTTLHKGFLLSSVMVVVNRPAFVGGSFI